MNIGPVHKKDVMKTSVMLERDNQYVIHVQEMYSTILNFNMYMCILCTCLYSCLTCGDFLPLTNVHGSVE